MNRENKRKQYETGYYRTHACHDSFFLQGLRLVGGTHWSGQ